MDDNSQQKPEFKTSRREEEIREGFFKAAEEEGETPLSNIVRQAVAEIVHLTARVEELEKKSQGTSSSS